MSMGVSTSDIQTHDERLQEASDYICADDSTTMEADETKDETGSKNESKSDTVDEDWSVLKGPVSVKIADLGNACWVVSDASHSVNMGTGLLF